MNAADPLATAAAPAEAPLITPAAAPATGPSAVPEITAAIPARRSLRGVIIVIVVLLFIFGGASGGVVWWLQQGTNAIPVAEAAIQPLAPEPSAPPVALKFELATAGAEPSGEIAQPSLAKFAERLPGVIAGLEERLAAVPIEGGTPAGLIVLASGGQSAGENSAVPRHQRWEIQFAPGNTIESYARQLDFFQIELGVLGGSDKVVYLSKLSEPKPVQRTDSAAAEERLYMIWQRGSMRDADEQIVARAEIATLGKVFAHFIPAELEAKLTKLEDAHARKINAAKIRKTIFGIKPDFEDGFQFYVIGQQADE